MLFSVGVDFLFAALLVGCQDDSRSERVTDTPGIVRMTDLNDHPDVVEVYLIAGAGETQYLPTGKAQVWAYRDGAKPGHGVHVPGPLIEAKQGDRVIVHFRNELPEGTTIHWRRVPL